MTQIDYTLVLSKKYSDKKWSMNGDSYDGLEWLDDSKKPSQKELEKLWKEISKELAEAKKNKQSARNTILEKIGITEEELALLLDK